PTSILLNPLLNWEHQVFPARELLTLISPSPKKKSAPDEPKLFRLLRPSPEVKDPKSPEAANVKPLEDWTPAACPKFPGNLACRQRTRTRKMTVFAQGEDPSPPCFLRLKLPVTIPLDLEFFLRAI